MAPGQARMRMNLPAACTRNTRILFLHEDKFSKNVHTYTQQNV